MPIKTASETWQFVQQVGFQKACIDWKRTLLLSFLAGLLVGFACLASVSVAYALPEIRRTNPGISKLIFSAIFPLGIPIIVSTGAMLFTGQSMSLAAALLYYQNKRTALLLVKNWSLVYLGNLAGCMFCAYAFGYSSELFEQDYYQEALRSIAQRKVEAGFGLNLLKGIPCNILVCLSIFCGWSADDMAGRIMAMWGPIFLFASFGFEHSVANMVFLTLGKLYGAEFNVGIAIGENLIPVTIGNIIGGSLFLSSLMWYVFTVAPQPSKHIPANPVPSAVAMSLLVPKEAPHSGPVIASTSSVQFNKRYINRQGEIVPTRLHSQLMIKNGRPFRVVTRVQRLNAVTQEPDEELGEGLVIATIGDDGRPGRLEYFDQVFARILGYDERSMHKLLGRSVDSITAKEDQANAQQAFQSLLTSPLLSNVASQASLSTMTVDAPPTAAAPHARSESQEALHRSLEHSA